LNRKFRDALVVESEFFGRYVEIVVDHLDEVALKVVDVCEGDATHLGDVLVCVVGVVEHFGGQKHRCQNEPREKRKRVNC